MDDKQIGPIETPAPPGRPRRSRFLPAWILASADGVLGATAIAGTALDRCLRLPPGRLGEGMPMHGLLTRIGP